MITTLLTKKIGDPVNIETDLIGKYVEKLFSKGGVGGQGRKGRLPALTLRPLLNTDSTNNRIERGYEQCLFPR